MSVTPISMMQVQGALQQSQRRFGTATGTNTHAANATISRFEALLREPQQVAEAMVSQTTAPQSQVQYPLAYYDIETMQQPFSAGMNLQAVSELATRVNMTSVDPNVFAEALSMLTDAAERNQLETVEASAFAGEQEELESSRLVDTVAAQRVATENVRPMTRGALATMFESGSDAPVGVVGYDATGGTSYGKYQFSSARGTMDDFLTYLDTYASDISLHLRAAGAVNTGSADGEMPTAWKEVAAIDPIRFEQMQDAFMTTRYYQPVENVVKEKMHLQSLSTAMEEVLLSTSVQHGPRGAVQIFAKAFGAMDDYSDAQQDTLIKNVYALRKQEFATSSPEIRTTVQARLERELDAALSLLA
ncbi:MAG: hypothetical protein MI749_16255 [Desulfovibrionales bacterium]|nr:hypothetical protein [Desulfovibrionales bacterium]